MTSAESIDDVSELKRINSNLESLFSGFDMNKKPLNSETVNDGLKMSTKYSKQEYMELIDVCNQLWVVNGLLKEFENDDDFESKIYKFNKLTNKIGTLKRDVFHDQDIQLINEIEEKLEKDKSKLMDKCKCKLTEFLVIDTSSLDVIFSKDTEGLTFNAFLKYCHELTKLENSHFLELNNLFNNWMSKILLELDQDKIVEFESIEDKLRLNVLDCHDSSLLKKINSIGAIINFFNEFSEIAKLQSIRYIINNQILKFIRSKIFLKENVYPLIVDKLDYDAHADGPTSEISLVAQLYKVSNMLSEKGWSKDGICELEFWMDDLINCWIDDLTNNSIDSLKFFVIDLINDDSKKKEIFGRLITQKLESLENNAEMPVQKTVVANKTEAATADNAGEWTEQWEDDDDGWGDDEDLDLDLASTNNEQQENSDQRFELKPETQSKDRNLDVDIDDGWDAWNEDEDEDEELNIESEAKPVCSVIPSFQYSQIVKEIVSILEKYMTNYEDLTKISVGENEVIKDSKHLFNNGIKKLCTSYFMIMESNMREVYDSEILFYNDYNKILEECFTLYGIDNGLCLKLNSKFINQYINDYVRKVLALINEYNPTLWNGEFNNDTKYKSIKQEFIIRFANLINEMLNEILKLTELNTQLVVNIIINVLFQLFNSICEKILELGDISSTESEVLTEIITEVCAILEGILIRSEIDLQKIQSFNKLTQIKLILSNNLKTIQGLFYDGSFFEIETNELVSLIEALFMESDQRLFFTQEVQTVRSQL